MHPPAIPTITPVLIPVDESPDCVAVGVGSGSSVDEEGDGLVVLVGLGVFVGSGVLEGSGVGRGV